jgi:hypothetical protein
MAERSGKKSNEPRIYVRTTNAELERIDKLAQARNLDRSAIVRESLDAYFKDPKNDLSRYFSYKCPRGCGFEINCTDLPDDDQKALIKKHEKECKKRR